MAKIITDKILNSRQFAEYYTGLYFMQCDTFQEVKSCIASSYIFISDGYNLSDIPKALSELPEDAATVIVQFSSEEDYTRHEYRLMRIQKKYLKRFLKNMKTDENSEKELLEKTDNE